MTLRARLAFLYTFIVGGILLLFGTAVYVTVSVILTNQINYTLGNVAAQVIDQARVNQQGDLEVSLADINLFADVYVQVWTRDHQLLAFSDNVRGLNRPLDAVSMGAVDNVLRDVTVSGVHLQVLTVPIVASNRITGVNQVGTSLTSLDIIQTILLRVLFGGAIISMAVAGLVAWISTQQALSPLETVTQTALQITRADDLSRRIPYQGPQTDDVGQLIHAFNQTLSRLEKLFNTQRRFLADVGHELRTPLTVIKGNVDLMRRMNCTDDESLDSIDNEVSRLTRLVGDLLLLAQAESGRLPLARETIELDTLLLEAMQQMSVLARDRLQLKLETIDQVLVCGDADRLKQVLVNLIGNAIQYTPPGGEVTVGLGKVDERARLTISDTGPGIPAEDLPHIFERFYRGEKSRTRSKDGKGFGLGLSIAYWIVRNHGGQIEVTNRDPHGTTFCIWLPLAKGSCREEAQQDIQ